MSQAQGALSQILIQREASYKTASSTVKSKKVYFIDEAVKFSSGIDKSPTIRGAARHPSQGSSGNVEVAGPFSAELQANIFAWFAALGSVETAQTGGTMGTALTSPSAVIDATNCIMTVTSTAHGLVAGDTVEITGLTAPTSLNSKVFAVFDAPTANTFKIAIPINTTTTFTLGSGAIKKVTTPGTVFTYTLKAGGALPSYIYEKGFPDIGQYMKYIGCLCGGFSFDVLPSGILKVSYNWMGANRTGASSSFDTGTPVDNGKRVFDAMSLAATDTKEGGSASAIIKSLSFNFDNQLDGDTFVVGGQGSRAAINSGVYSIGGKISAVFQDQTLYNKAINKTETSFDLTFKRGDGGGTDGNESMQIVTPELNLANTDPVISGPKGILFETDFDCYYDNAADATALKIIIKNAIPPGLLI